MATTKTTKICNPQKFLALRYIHTYVCTYGLHQQSLQGIRNPLATNQLQNVTVNLQTIGGVVCNMYIFNLLRTSTSSRVQQQKQIQLFMTRSTTKQVCKRLCRYVCICSQTDASQTSYITCEV